MRNRPPHPSALAQAGRVVRFAAVLLLAGTVLSVAPPAASAADGLTMEARVLLGGHARVGSWIAIAVHLRNDGPTVSGELRLAGGTQGRTRFGTAIEVATESDKETVIYAQPPAFGQSLTVDLVDGGRTVASAKATFQVHDASQLIVAVVAEHPERFVGSLGLLPNQNQALPVVVGMNPEDLPANVAAWSSVDRIIWQDVDSERLTTDQRAALRGWLAGGGRLVIAGGTAGPRSLSAFPDALLPYRPVVTSDVPAAHLATLLGGLPSGASDLPALAGPLAEGRALATDGDNAIAAERTYGSGAVTIIGFDPTVDWIARTSAAPNLWRRLLPDRTYGGLSFFDDNLLVAAVSQLPALALPPIGGLLVLLAGYIVLIGPLNYLVLRRLDRREWAWVTMPVLIIAFAGGAYGIGAALRGSEVIVHEVAIVRGSPGTSEGSAQVYLGVFSPARSTYQLSVPGGALLSTPTTGDVFGADPTADSLDVLQGDPARIRDLAIGFQSLRTIRAEAQVQVPLVATDLRLQDGRLKGTVTNQSSVVLERPAVVFGRTVAVLSDLAPGASASVDLRLSRDLFGPSLSDAVIGPTIYSDSGPTSEMARTYVRHNMVDQLTYDPNFGSTNQLAADGPVVLAWSSADLLPVDVAGQKPRRLGNVLYYLPSRVAIAGKTTFQSDLIRSTIVETDALFFSKEPTALSFGRGSVTMAYRPIGFEGGIRPTELAINLNWGDPGLTIPPEVVDPLPSIPPPCPNPATEECNGGAFDGVPEVEVYDLAAAEWKRLPHLSQGTNYAVAHPERYVDPTSGTALIRYVNDLADNVGFSVNISISGDIG